MAEHGAHITSGTSGETEKPSIFEVLAQESLKAAIQPALEHAFRIIAQKNPERYGWLYRWTDELYSILDLVLESYYLRNYDGSFAENFYGIRRVPLDNANTFVQKLSRKYRLRSIFFLVLLPYIKRKCEKFYEVQKEKQHYFSTENVPIEQNKSFQKKLVNVFLRAYPILHMSVEALTLAYHFLYIIGKSAFHSPYLRLAGVRLANLTEHDMLSHETVGRSLDLTNKSFIQQVWAVIGQSAHYLAIALSTGLSVGVFFLQFLEWWYASDQKAVSLTSLPTPDPPQKREVEYLPKMNNICPLCNKIRTNDTVLSVTGFVFCYPCIYRHVQQHRTCPVTNYPAQTDHLVKLYLPDG